SQTVYGVVRRAADGKLTHIAGHYTTGADNSEGAPATVASFTSAPSMAFDAGGNLYIGTLDDKVWRIDGATGTLGSVVGTGTEDHTGDYGSASAATVKNLNEILILPNGNLAISDGGNYAVRIVYGLGESKARAATLSINSGNNQTLNIDKLGAPFVVK